MSDRYTYDFQYNDHFARMTFSELRANLPTLRRTIYDALQVLTPHKLRWYLDEFVGDYYWSDEMIDNDTRDIILMVLADITGIKRLRMTHEELRLAYTRFNELQMLKDAVDQELLHEVIPEDGSPTEYKVLHTEIISVLEPLRVRATMKSFGALIYIK